MIDNCTDKLRYDMAMKNLPTITCILLLATSPAAMAEIYKWVDAEGNVVYSDVPDKQAQEFKPPSMNTVIMPKPPQPEPEAQPQQALSYRLLSIVQPDDDAVVRDNNGRLTIELKSEPPLQQGHTFRILMDGRVVVKSSRAVTVTLDDVDRGEHNIQAQIRDAKGRTLKRSKPVVVHMKRNSRLLNPPAGASRPAGTANHRPGPARPDFKPGPVGSRFTPGPATLAPANP